MLLADLLGLAARHWRLIAAASVLALIWWLSAENADLQTRIADKDAAIAALQGQLEQRAAVAREVANLAAQREQAARRALDEARAKAADREAEIARLRAARAGHAPSSDRCAEIDAIEAMLREYRERRP